MKFITFTFFYAMHQFRQKLNKKSVKRLIGAVKIATTIEITIVASIETFVGGKTQWYVSGLFSFNFHLQTEFLTSNGDFSCKHDFSFVYVWHVPSSEGN